jgi:predicted MFS family arabinose efflux permease
MASTLGIGLCLLPMGLLPHVAAAGTGRIGAIVLWATWLPALQAFQMVTIDREWHSLSYGIVSMAMGFGFGSISLAGGFVIAAIGYRNLFLIGSVFAAAGAMLMWGIRRHRLGQTGRTTTVASEVV